MKKINNMVDVYKNNYITNQSNNQAKEVEQCNQKH